MIHNCRDVIKKRKTKFIPQIFQLTFKNGRKIQSNLETNNKNKNTIPNKTVSIFLLHNCNVTSMQYSSLPSLIRFVDALISTRWGAWIRLSDNISLPTSSLYKLCTWQRQRKIYDARNTRAWERSKEVGSEPH